jgi:hypothetical protein
MPRWNLVYFFFLFFKNLIPYVTKQGVWVSCLVKVQCTFSFCVFQISSPVWLYNTNGFGIEIMYDYYIVLKSMFFVVKLFSHLSIVYASLTILLPWTKHKQAQNHSKSKTFQNQNFNSNKLCIHIIILYKWRCFSRSQTLIYITTKKKLVKKLLKVYASHGSNVNPPLITRKHNNMVHMTST